MQKMQKWQINYRNEQSAKNEFSHFRNRLQSDFYLVKTQILKVRGQTKNKNESFNNRGCSTTIIQCQTKSKPYIVDFYPIRRNK